MSNNSSKSREEYLRKFQALDIEAHHVSKCTYAGVYRYQIMCTLYFIFRMKCFLPHMWPHTIFKNAVISKERCTLLERRDSVMS